MKHIVLITLFMSILDVCRATGIQGVRLVHGRKAMNGRVEVLVDGEWGTVCDDQWDDNDAGVVCRSLGYLRGALTARGEAYYGEGEGPILLDNVNCEGNETSIADCESNPIGENDCTHREDAGVECEESIGPSIPYRDDHLCGSDWLASNGNIAECNPESMYPCCSPNNLCGITPEHCDCEDCIDFRDYVRRVSDPPSGFPKFRDDYRCGASVLAPNGDPAECDPEGILPCCSPSGWCGVTSDHCDCEKCVDYRVKKIERIRLANGDAPNVGRVEVLVDGEWGTVCDDLWDIRDANVTCRMLGYPGAIAERAASYFGEGTDFPIWLDNVLCRGTELSLQDCPKNEIGIHNCGHHEDAGVECELPVIEDVRLVGGVTPNIGRVEVWVNREWGTVCDDLWDLNDAQVTCRMLGYPGAIRERRLAYFGEGTGRTWLDNVNCSGSERSLQDCSKNDIGDEDCEHYEDAGVECAPLPSEENGNATFYRDDLRCGGTWFAPNGQLAECNPEGDHPCCSSQNLCGRTREHCDCDECVDYRGTGSIIEDVRLVGGDTSSSGRVEVQVNGQWGTVCHDKWSIEDATVVCRWLGFPGVHHETIRASFGEGTGPIWLDNVRCNGDEETLNDCRMAEIGDHNCDHREDAGVVCQGLEGVDQIKAVRLMGGNHYWIGRVEVLVNRQWGAICDDYWDLNDAQVVCRMLGYGVAEEVYHFSEFGGGPGRIWLDDVDCFGNETSLDECRKSNIGEHNCGQSEHAGVKCNPWMAYRNDTKCGGGWLAPNGDVAICNSVGKLPCCSSEKVCGDSPEHCECEDCVDYRTVENPRIEEVRLIDGPSDREGRVEVKVLGQWGTICHNSWDHLDANIVCRQLGYTAAKDIYYNAHYGEGVGRIWLNRVNCGRSGVTLNDCGHAGFAPHEECDHSQDAGIACYPLHVSPTTEIEDIRLRDGYSHFSGRVEVFVNGEWGTVCSDRWDIEDANVACRWLGYDDGAYSARRMAFFGEGTGPIWIDNIRCVGNEETLNECRKRPLGDHDCGHEKDAGVECDRGTIEPTIYGVRAGADYREDLRCGGGFHAPNGRFAYCKRDGEFPCCNTDTNYCGNTPEYCECDRCIDYRDDSVHDIRLSGGGNPDAGKVEVFIFGRWGSVCSDYWDMNDAQVACRQLGYSGAVEIKRDDYYGEGEDPVLIDDLHCTGQETSLSDCPRNPPGAHDCDHRYEVANVVCASPTTPTVPTSPPYREDNYCGAGYLAPNGEEAICNPNGPQPCCPPFNRCGNTTYHCNCPTCIDFRYAGKGYRPDFRCGKNNVAPNGEIAICDATGTNPCCSFSGWCGSGDNYCECSGCTDFRQQEGSPRIQGVRLTNGLTKEEGRVEVRVQGHWGTICSNSFDLADANVVCRQMGYRSAEQTHDNLYYGVGVGRIWLNNVNCGGNEESLNDCPHDGFGLHEECEHSHDVGVACTPNLPPSVIEDIRLRDGYSQFSGRVEVYVGGEWGTVCSDRWDIEDAHVACRWLGFDGADSAKTMAFFGEGSGPIWIDNARCVGDEETLNECKKRPLGDHNCRHSKDAGVECSMGEPTIHGVRAGDDYREDLRCGGGYHAPNGRFAYCKRDGEYPCCNTASNWCGNTPEHCECDGCIDYRDDSVHDIRLRGGGYPNVGKVEVFIFGRWGSVCSDYWDMSDAQVACRQLGYPGAVEIKREDYYGEGEDPVLIDDLHCTGQETSLSDCPRNPPGAHDCDHRYEVANVVCALPQVTTPESITQTSISDPTAMKPYRDDFRCGGTNLAPDGRIARCNVHSTNYCCSSSGWCGSGYDYCECNGCTNYREELGKGTSKYRSDFRCGYDNVAPNGEIAICDGNSANHCCSANGWCGSGFEYCECHGCIDYREEVVTDLTPLPFRDDRRCGGSFLAPNGQIAECEMTGDYPCCSSDNWCGNSTEECECDTCIDYRYFLKPYRSDLRCGDGYLAPNGRKAICNWNSTNYCCSDVGWCGASPEYCDCFHCVNYRSESVIEYLKQDYRDDFRCGGSYLAPNGEVAKCNADGEFPCCSSSFWCSSAEERYCRCQGCVDYRTGGR